MYVKIVMKQLDSDKRTLNAGELHFLKQVFICVEALSSAPFVHIRSGTSNYNVSVTGTS